MTDSIEMIEISKDRYDELLEREAWLGCLEAAGVDNWPGIDEAFDMMDGEDDG